MYAGSSKLARLRVSYHSAALGLGGTNLGLHLRVIHPFVLLKGWGRPKFESIAPSKLRRLSKLARRVLAPTKARVNSVC